MLKGYKKIVVPGYKSKVADIMNIIRTNIQDHKKMNKYAQSFIDQSLYFDDIISYVDIYYLILQLKLEQTYIKFMTEFPKSDAFEHYQRLHTTLTPARRWAQTIVDANNLKLDLYSM